MSQALRENNQNVGGGKIVLARGASVIQGIGRMRTPEQIENTMIRQTAGVPVHIRDVAEVAIGYGIRRGGVTADGKGEVVLGQAFMRMGENSREVTMALDQALMLSDGIGSEVQRPLATVVVFGMACDTVLMMLVLPVLYLLFRSDNSNATASSRT